MSHKHELHRYECKFHPHALSLSDFSRVNMHGKCKYFEENYAKSSHPL